MEYNLFILISYSVFFVIIATFLFSKIFPKQDLRLLSGNSDARFEYIIIQIWIAFVIAVIITFIHLFAWITVDRNNLWQDFGIRESRECALNIDNGIIVKNDAYVSFASGLHYGDAIKPDKILIDESVDIPTMENHVYTYKNLYYSLGWTLRTPESMLGELKEKVTKGDLEYARKN